jgi:hypothetical protein
MVPSMKTSRLWLLLIPVLVFCPLLMAVESGMCRLLSVSESEKLILVSQIPGKAKYLLDAASAKITVDGKAAEFKELKAFSILLVKMELRKSTKSGIEIDGTATEIRISNAEKTK